MSQERPPHELLALLGEVLVVLSDITDGDLQSRCPTNLPEAHPFFRLCMGLNYLFDSIETEKARGVTSAMELEEKLATIQAQHASIQKLWAPIIEVWDGVLCLLVVGRLHDARSAAVTSALLQAVASQRARCAIIDITGIKGVDAASAEKLIMIVKAVRLLGAECVLAGVQPHVAMLLLQSGVALEGISPYATLHDALRGVQNKRE